MFPKIWSTGGLGKLVETVTRTAVIVQAGGAYGTYEHGPFEALWEANIRPES